MHYFSKLLPLWCFFLLFYTSGQISAQQAESAKTDGSWLVQRKPHPSFIQNKGQFQPRNKEIDAATVLFAYDGNHDDFLFTKNGLIVELTVQKKRKKSEEEKAERSAKKKIGFKDAAEFRAFEEVGHTLHIDKDELIMTWLDANENPEILVENKDPFYHSYSFYDFQANLINLNEIPSWKKLIYKNLYDNIDVVYEIHPISGFKYSIIVHPGGDITKVKLKYSKKASLQSDGSIATNTFFGDIVDHDPKTFYEGNENNLVNSYYQVNEDIISFILGNYDANKTIVIDPWTQMPNFPTTNWDCVWECERDGLGNVYIIGGTSPLQLIKYNAAGAVQSTKNTP